MRYRPQVLPTASVEEGIGVVQALGPGVVALDLERAFIDQPMTQAGWSIYFRDIHDRLASHDVQLVVLTSPRHRADTTATIPASLASIVDRSSRPKVTATRVGNITRTAVVALWGEQSLTNARIAHHLHAPLVRIDAANESFQRRVSRRAADLLLGHQRPG